MCINELNEIIETKPKLKNDKYNEIFIGLKIFSHNNRNFVIVEDKDGDVFHFDLDNISLVKEIKNVTIEEQKFDFDRFDR